MFRWIRRHAFAVTLIIALAAIIASCVSTYRALDQLPRAHRQVMTLKERLIRLGHLRSNLGAASSRFRALSLGGDELDRSELVEAIARSEQLVDELLAFDRSSQTLFIACRDHLAEIRQRASDANPIDSQQRKRLREQSSELRSQLAERIADQQEQLSKLQQSALRDRSVAVWTLFAGHLLMLAIVGLLYMARRSEKRQRVQAELRTLEADERFALIVRGSADGIILTDQTGRIQMTNPSLQEMFDSQESELNGESVGSLFATTIVDEWLSNRLRNDDRESVLSRMVTAMKKDGSRFQAELTITPRTIRKQEFLAISVRDVSEREVSRLRLMQHEALLSEIPEPLQILDSVETIVYWNRGAEQLFGYSSSEAIGQTANDLLRIIPPKGESNNVHSLGYADAEHWAGELRAMTKDGRWLRIERRRTRIREAEETIGEVVFDLDLGERSRLQQVERRRQRLESLGTLSSGIAHDLNNLLTPILMSSRMLQRDAANIDRQAMLETIVSGASRGAELIEQLLTFARGGDGQHQPIRIDELLSEVTGILRHTLPKDVDLEAEIATDLPEILGDATEIGQVAMNLAINARDAMASGGKLSIVASRLSLTSERSYSFATLQPGEYVSIAVSDTGTGIPASIRDRIFDPFFTTKERGQGTGLGLSTSIGIVRSHKGAVNVRSTVGKGTTITVILPCEENQESDQDLKP